MQTNFERNIMKDVNYENTYKKDLQLGDKTIHIEIGKFSQQTSAAVLISCGETVVHTTVALGRKVNLGYFPLSVEFMEKLYAGGIIKGSRWVKRDGKPSDDTILKARVIDRTMRPLFTDGIRNEVQIINTIFSYDGENEPDMLALLASGIALTISNIPFEGPIAGVRVGYNKENAKFVFNPTKTEQVESDLDLIVSGTGNSIVMVEAGANEVSEEVIIDALELVQKEFVKVCADIVEIQKEIGKEKLSLLEEKPEEEIAFEEKLTEEIKAKYSAQIKEIVEKRAKLQDSGFMDLIEKIVDETNEGKEGIEDLVDSTNDKQVEAILYKLMKAQARRMILEDNIRPDGRKTDEIRQIWCETDVFPRTHGSAMFKRGATQGVTVTTLGAPSLGMHSEDLDGDQVKHYMHFYNMPPYASGEAGRMGWPKRREVGHGALAERALLPMIPSQEEFPYAIHAVTEILSSNGSTSQAAVCGSTLSLMAAGVPIKRPVSGIAMGMMSDGEKYVILSDIQGMEDHVGDMDFKVAGSSEGITAIQMDIKLKGLSREILVQALEQSKIGRQHILQEMLKCINTPRVELSAHAPKIEQITIPTEKIGELIGPGGKMIKEIIAKSGAQVDVEEDKEKEIGMVFISSSDQAEIDAASTMVNNIVRVVEVGDEFDGTVVRIEAYGAFVEYLPGRDGLVHVSAMSADYVSDPNTLVKLGDTVHVRVAEIKEDGKIGLSMLTAEQEAEAKNNASARGARPTRTPFRGGRDNGGDRGGRGGYSGARNGGSRGQSRGGNRRFSNDRRSGGDRKPAFKSQMTSE